MSTESLSSNPEEIDVIKDILQSYNISFDDLLVAGNNRYISFIMGLVGCIVIFITNL